MTPLLSLADAELAQTDRHRGIAAGPSSALHSSSVLRLHWPAGGSFLGAPQIASQMNGCSCWPRSLALYRDAAAARIGSGQFVLQCVTGLHGTLDGPVKMSSPRLPQVACCRGRFRTAALASRSSPRSCIAPLFGPRRQQRACDGILAAIHHHFCSTRRISTEYSPWCVSSSAGNGSATIFIFRLLD